MHSDNARIKILKKSVEELRECGEFLWKINTLETEDCLCDAMELGIVQESISKRIREMIDTLKSEYIKQNLRETKKNGKKDCSFNYLELEQRSDVNTRL